MVSCHIANFSHGTTGQEVPAGLQLLNKYSVVEKKVTVLLRTSLAWLAWAGYDWAELFFEPGTNFFAQPCIVYKVPNHHPVLPLPLLPPDGHQGAVRNRPRDCGGRAGPRGVALRAGRRGGRRGHARLLPLRRRPHEARRAGKTVHCCCCAIQRVLNEINYRSQRISNPVTHMLPVGVS